MAAWRYWPRLGPRCVILAGVSGNRVRLGAPQFKRRFLTWLTRRSEQFTPKQMPVMTDRNSFNRLLDDDHLGAGELAIPYADEEVMVLA